MSDRPTCYNCGSFLPPDTDLTDPFCNDGCRADWQTSNYDPEHKQKKHGRTLEEAIARCRELGGLTTSEPAAE